MSFFKKILVGLVVLAISSAIFLFMTNDKTMRANVLSATLKMMGDELLAVVPDSPQKEELNRRYQDFLQRAEKDQVSREEVEHVAATVFNLKAAENSVTAEDALKALELETGTTDTSESKIVFIDRKKREKRLDEKDREKLAEQLSQMQDFQKNMYSLARKDTAFDGIKGHFFFTADSGLKVVIDPHIQNVIVSQKLPHLEKQFKELEKMRMLEWKERRRFYKHMMREMQNNWGEIPQLFEKEFMRNIPGLIATLDSLNLDSHNVENPDSIEIVIRKIAREVSNWPVEETAKGAPPKQP